MTLLNKSPMARKAAWSYCHRCLAVMLCCVLVFGLVVPAAPRAQASVVDGTSAVEIVGGPNLTVIKGGASGGSSSAAASVTGSTFGAFLLAASGINMMVDSIEYSTTRYYGGTVYEEGNELWDYLWNLGGDIGAWCMGVDSRAQEAGGIRPGDSYTIPADVLEATRQWALGNIDFTDGSSVYTQRGFFTGDSQVIFTSFPSGYAYNKVPPGAASLGTVVPFGSSFSFSFHDVDGVPWVCDVYASESGSSVSQLYRFYKDGNAFGSETTQGANSSFFHLREFDGSYYLCVGLVAHNTGYLQFTGEYWKTKAQLDSRYPCVGIDIVSSVSTTFTKTDGLDQPKTDELTITIPPQLPTTQIDELTIPVITEITSSSLTEIGSENNPGTDSKPGTNLTPAQITEAITNALPITGSQIGDKTTEETMEDPDNTKSAFITRFPFSIPWDIAKAIKLLAAPPVTPRWELDFMAPIAGRVGGWRGDTTVVLDFGEYPIVGIATRWLSTVMFLYGLASATKRLMWPS